MMNLPKFLFLSKNPGIFARNISCSQRKFFSSFDEIKKLDMESKNTHLNIDLVNPFGDEENDAKPTEWRRYWNINDSPEVQYNKKHRKYYIEVTLTVAFLVLLRYHGKEEHMHFYPIH